MRIVHSLAVVIACAAFAASSAVWAETAGIPDATAAAGAANDEPTMPDVTATEEPGPKVLSILGKVVEPGTTALLYWTPGVAFDGNSIPRGVIVANGAKPGPTLCLTAVIHGDEHNGLEIVRRILYELDPAHLSGVVIGVPIVNLDGFRRGTRYLPDRRDLNRYFPGKPNGSAAARLAYSLFDQIIKSCDDLVDIHTGSFHRTNLPQLRGDLTNLDVLELSRRFGPTVILHNRGEPGTLRRAATDAGIPAVTLETGEPMRIQDREIREGVRAIERAMTSLAMYPRAMRPAENAQVYFESRWVRVNEGGVLMSNVRLGDMVEPGARLGTVTDPITNHSSEVIAPYAGRVLGMALNQVVLPGYAAFHIGIESSIEGAKATDALERSIIAPADAGTEDDSSDTPDAPDSDLESAD